MWRRDEQGNQFSFFLKKKRGGRKEGKRQRDAYPRKGQGCCLSDKKPFLWCLVGPTPNERHAHSALLLLVCRTRNANLKTLSTDAPVRFAYQPPARQYFSLRTNRAPPTSQRYFFSPNKPAPAVSETNRPQMTPHESTIDELTYSVETVFFMCQLGRVII